MEGSGWCTTPVSHDASAAAIPTHSTMVANREQLNPIWGGRKEQRRIRDYPNLRSSTKLEVAYHVLMFDIFNVCTILAIFFITFHTRLIFLVFMLASSEKSIQTHEEEAYLNPNIKDLNLHWCSFKHHSTVRLAYFLSLLEREYRVHTLLDYLLSLQ